jgi:hypothetical protein
MNKPVVLTLVFVLVLPAALQAQDAPRADIYVGFPLLYRADSNSLSLLGVHGSLALNVSERFGLAADAGGYFGEVFSDHSISTFLGGPVFSLRSGTRLQVFGHTLLGGARVQDGASTVFATALGGGVAVRTGRRLAVRAQLDVLTTRFRSQTQNFLRTSFGVSIPLGRLSNLIS